MNKKKLAEALFTALILGVIGGVTLFSNLYQSEEFSIFENRTLSPKPELETEAVLSGEYFDDLESYLCDEAAGRTTILKWETWMDLNVLHRPVVNDVVVTNDNLLLAYEEYEAVNQEAISADASAMATQLAQIDQQVRNYGGTFLYVMVPSHYAYFQDSYPFYLNNRSQYTQAEVAALTEAMETVGVPYLDMGQVWAAEGNPPAYFSTVDHHFTWEGAFDVYTHMMEAVNCQREEPLAVLTAGDVETVTLPNPYLGSRSRKLFNQWQDGERLTYGRVKEDIPFTRYNWGSDTPGESTLWTLPETPWETVSYTLYMGGDISETVIQTGRQELPRGLMVGDSFTNALETLYYASFDETRSLDFRYYEEMSLPDYLAEYQPDVVVCVRDYEQLLSFSGNGALVK